MEIKKYKEKNRKKIGILLFTLACVFLVVGVILYQTYAIYEVLNDKDLLNGNVGDPGDIYFAFYKDGELQKEMPKKEDGYILDETKSTCGVMGSTDPNIKVMLSDDEIIHVIGVTTSRTKCNLYFIKGIYLLGKGMSLATEGNGLYEVKHENVTGTLNDSGFSQTEYRYAGSEPNNYIKFNNELWRIIGLVNVMTSETKVEQRVKIVKKDVEEVVKWDEDKLNNWSSSSLQIKLNTVYFNKLEDISNSIEKNIYWNLGFLSSYNNNPTLQVYNEERGSVTSENGSTTWKGAIALIYPSDYGYATSGNNKENRSTCLERALYRWNNTDEMQLGCLTNDWIRDMTYFQWTLSGIKSGTKYVAYLNSAGYVSQNFGESMNYKPTLYLKPNVKIISGEGTNSNPFNLSQILQ